MKRAILTVGPQYAGKSTFCKRLIAKYPGTAYISRDEILERMFGSAWLSPYTGCHQEGWRTMWMEIAQKLRVEEVTLILDAWNGFPREREIITRDLRQYGADVVEAWYFVTPVATCIEWSFLRRPLTEATEQNLKMVQRWQAESVRRDYDLYHSQGIVREPYFDRVRYINPLVSDGRALLDAPCEQLILRGLECT